MELRVIAFKVDVRCQFLRSNQNSRIQVAMTTTMMVTERLVPLLAMT